MNELTNAAILDAPVLPERYRKLGLVTPDEFREMERIRTSRFYLVRNSGPHGEPLRCGRCGVLHTYFTWHCIEQPFAGLDDALYAYTKVSRNPEDRRTIIESLSSANASHPSWSREQLAPDSREDVLTVAVGIVEPISEQQARRLERLIRGRDGSFTLTVVS